MATKTAKKAPKTASKISADTKTTLPESPDAADAIASTAWVSVAKNIDPAIEPKDETAVVEAKKTPDEEFEVEYGKVIRERDQTGLLSAILKELFLLRTSRG